MSSRVSQEYSPKYRIIADELRKKILSGEYAPGETLPPQRALVLEYKVSLSTVRQSLAVLAREGAVRPEAGRGFFVQPLEGAVESIRRQRSAQIGFACCAPHDQEIAYMIMVNGASEAAQTANHTIRYMCIRPDESRGVEHCVELAPDLEGIIVCGEVNPANLHGGLLDHTKLVILGHLPDNTSCESFSWITANGHAAAHLAVQMLLLAGHERIGLLTCPARTSFFKELEQGFTDACRDAGIPEPTVFRTEQYVDESVAPVADEIANCSSVTGLVVIDDHRAARLVGALRERGRNVPGDISIVGIGGLPRNLLAIENLSRVDIGYRQMGAEAAKVLISSNADVMHKSLPVYVDRGETIAPPHSPQDS